MLVACGSECREHVKLGNATRLAGVALDATRDMSNAFVIFVVVGWMGKCREQRKGRRRKNWKGAGTGDGERKCSGKGVELYRRSTCTRDRVASHVYDLTQERLYTVIWLDHFASSVC